jgi:isopentenyl diphosphate isomerase/L-lactate dehydrogenase-like FMN-dependent dehydrogenase
VHFEGEMGAIVGRRARHVPADEAMDYIFGYTCVNDVTAVDLLRKNASFEQWARCKGFDTFGAFGPVMQKLLDPGASWKDVEWVRSLWKGPMILKGILHPDEARQAAALGIDAIVVSNHGGRQYDSAISGIRALAPIFDAVGGKTVVLVDGGFRRGADIVKALALGATAVMIGRPQLWGVACAGEEGVHWVLELLAKEIDRALALGSWDDIRKLDRSIFANPSPWP